MHRVSLSLSPAVYNLVKNKANKSKYIADLILQDAYHTHKDELAERTAQALLSNESFIHELTNRLKTTSHSSVVDWGA